MSVVNIKENWSGYRYRQVIKQNKRTLRRVFTVLLDGTDSSDKEAMIAVRAVQVLVGEYWEHDNTMRVTDVGDAEPKGLHFFEVPVQYESLNGASPGSGPYNEPYDISEGEYVSRELVDSTPFERRIVDSAGTILEPVKQFAGNLVNHTITNILGETYDPAPSTDIYDWQATITFNVPFINRPLLQFMLGKLNGFPFMDAGAGLVKFHGCRRQIIRQGTLIYSRLSMQFLTRSQEIAGVNYGWLERRLHSGTKAWINTQLDGTPNILALTDNDGIPETRRRAIDQSGVPIDYAGDAAPPTWMLIQHFNNGLVDFGVLGLDEDQLA